MKITKKFEGKFKKKDIKLIVKKNIRVLFESKSKFYFFC